MWILTYDYTLLDGETVHISCCLKKSVSYSIGRSGKNLLSIKNDKSISRKHITVNWDKHGMLKVINEGKLTAIHGKYLTQDEIYTYKMPLRVKPTNTNTVGENDSSYFVDEEVKNIEISLGTKPIIVTIVWKPFNLLVPDKYENECKDLLNLGISAYCEADENLISINKIDAILESNEWMNERPYRSLLIIFKRNCSFMSENFFERVNSKIGENHSNFNQIWQELLRTNTVANSKNANANDYLHKILKSITFILIGNIDHINKNYFKTSLNAIGSSYLFYDNIDIFKSKVHSELSSDRFILINSSDNDIEKITSLHYKVCSISQLLMRLIDNTFEELMNDSDNNSSALTNSITQKQRDEPNITAQPNLIEGSNRPIDPSIEDKPLPIKRRRLNRPKVEPLNSLSFFAGGDDVQKQKPNNNIKTKELEGKEPEGKESEGKESEGKETDGASLINNKYKSPTVSKKRLDISEHLESSHSLNSNVKNITPTTTQTKYMSNELTVSSPEKNIIDSSHEIENETNPADVNTNQVPENKGPVRGKSSTLVEVIQSTKTKEVERLQSGLVDIQPIELTEDAINEFSNLNIEVNPNLMKKRSSYSNSDSLGPWQGRKNFKKFVKVWPGSRHDNDSLKNKAFLITRNYVDFKPYGSVPKKEDNSRNKSHEMIQPNLENMDEDERLLTEMQQKNDHDIESDNEDENSFSFSKSILKGNGLFVGDDDSDENDFNEKTEKEVDEFVGIGTTSNKGGHINSIKAMASMTPSTKSKIDHINIADVGTDSDDDGPTFKFRRKI